jgi:hypothetical protein
MVPSTQFLRVGFVATEPCQAALDKLQAALDKLQAALDKLQAGISWSAAGVTLVYRLAASDSLSRVRVTGCTQALSIDWLVARMALLSSPRVAWTAL